MCIVPFAVPFKTTRVGYGGRCLDTHTAQDLFDSYLDPFRLISSYCCSLIALER